MDGLRKLARFGSAGMTAGVTLAFCVVGGYYADRYLGTEPWLVVVGIVLGLVASFVSLIREALRGTDEDK